MTAKLLACTLGRCTPLLMAFLIFGCGGSSDNSCTTCIDTPPPPSTPPPTIETYGVDQQYQNLVWSGNYDVGIKRFYWQDLNRGEPHTQDESDNRELLVHVFYPAHVNLPDEPLAQLPERFWEFEGTYEALQGRRLRPSNYQEVNWDIHIEVPVSDTQQSYPLVTFSHGYGLSPEVFVYLAADLASRGFIVASINHPYGSSYAELPDDRLITSRRLPQDNLGVDLSLWSNDQLFTINQVQSLNTSSNSLFYQKLDDRIAAIGHSYGGAASYYSAWKDTRVKAAVDLDGTIFNSENKLITQPFMFIQSGAGSDLEIFDQVSNDGYAILFDNQVSHLAFADLSLYWEWDFPGNTAFGTMPSTTAMPLISDAIGQFLNKYLNGYPANLLDDTAHQPENVRIIRYTQ